MVTKATAPPVRAAVDAFLASLELSEAGDANAAIARALADRLDAAEGDSGAATNAVAAVAKELRATLADIALSASDTADFVGALFDE